MKQYYRLFIICAAKKRKEDDKNAKIMEEQQIKNEKERLKKVRKVKYPKKRIGEA